MHETSESEAISFINAPVDLDTFYRDALVTLGGVSAADIAEMPIDIISRIYAPRMNKNFQVCIAWMAALTSAQIFKEIELEDGLMRELSAKLLHWLEVIWSASAQRTIPTYHLLYPSLLDPSSKSFHAGLDTLIIHIQDGEGSSDLPLRESIGNMLLWLAEVSATLKIYEQQQGFNQEPNLLEFFEKRLTSQDMRLMYDLVEFVRTWLIRLEKVPAYQADMETDRIRNIIFDYVIDHTYTSSLKVKRSDGIGFNGNLHITANHLYVI